MRNLGLSGPGLVAVSGGADSTALLHALHELAVPCTVAHVNHALRGAESEADEAFVRGLAERLGVPTVCARLPPPPGENLEAAARRLRYDWLLSQPAAWIATAHTADDQAETVLHRIMRGSGLQGLRGIHPRRGRIVRPMLNCTRGEVLTYLRVLGQDYRTDASNADQRFTRNRIRHEVLPLLQSFNPEVVAALGRLAEQARAAFEVLEQQARGVLEQIELPRAGRRLIFHHARLLAQPLLLRREALRLAWQREAWPEADMTHEHWQRLAECAPGDYPGGISLRHAAAVVQLGPRS